VTTARKVLAVASGEPATDEATFNQPAARNTTLDNARRRTATNRRPKVRLFETDFSEESEVDVTIGSGGDVGGELGDGGELGGVSGLGGVGGASAIHGLVLSETPHLREHRYAVILHRVAPTTRVAES